MHRPKPSGGEFRFEEGLLISETDLSGVITYVNRKFAELNGYSKKELIGKPHNIVRHPDMPKGLFKQMWDTIQQNKEWNGLIKNLRKDGRFYWSEVFIKPIFKDGEKTGYIAAYHPAKTMDIEEAVKRYARMLEEEKKL